MLTMSLALERREKPEMVDVDLLQIKDAIRDGLRAVSNTLLDGFVVRGAGAFRGQTLAQSSLSEVILLHV